VGQAGLWHLVVGYMVVTVSEAGVKPCCKKHFLLFQLMHTIIKIIEMLKQFKIIILAPTCFGSRRNHHQGTVLCLAKTTNMVFLCTSV